MAERSVYLSSTFLDFEEIRKNFQQIIVGDLSPWYKLSWIMEHMRSNGENRSPIDQCVKQVRLSDIYILLIGDRYGSEVEFNGKYQSYTEHEFDAAIEAGVSTIFLIFGDDNFHSIYNDQQINGNRTKLAKFKEKAQEGRLNARKITSLQEAINDFMVCLYIDLHKRLIGRNIEIKPTIKYTINRTLQDTLYDKYNEPLERRLVVPAFIFTRDVDRPELYTKKIWYLKFQMAMNYTKSRIRSDFIPISSEKRLNYLIRNTTGYFLDGKNENIFTFEDLLRKKPSEGQKILEFEISVEETKDESGTWVKLITTYLNQIQEKFKPNSDRIYALIHIYYKEYISVEEMTRIIGLFKFKNISGRPDLTPLNLQQLRDIQMSELKQWVKQNFDESESAIIIKQLDNPVIYNQNTNYTYQSLIDEFKFKI